MRLMVGMKDICTMNHLKIALLLLMSTSLLLLMGCKKDPLEEEEEPSIQIQVSEFCEDTCVFANDGECDDGGSNSKSNFCEYGTDCSDCDVRSLVRVVD